MILRFKEGSTKKEKIDRAARFIIVHSIIYYEMDYNVISDKEFDKTCRWLADKVERFPKGIKSCNYYEAIKDFDGTTGFDLIYRCDEDHQEYLRRIATMVVNNYQIDKNKAKGNR